MLATGRQLILAAIFILSEVACLETAETADGQSGQPYVPAGQTIVLLSGAPTTSVFPVLSETLQKTNSLIATIPKSSEKTGVSSLKFTISQAKDLHPSSEFVETAAATLDTVLIQTPNPIALPQAVQLPAAPAGGPKTYVENPASIACLYGLNNKLRANSCATDANLPLPTGGSSSTVIAAVVPYDAPNAVDDLNTFARVVGLPPPRFKVEYASGSKPAYDKAWEVEASLDIEWAFAMAPNANILLVEATSNQPQDLATAVEYAANHVSQRGGGQVFMSWIFSSALTNNDLGTFEHIFTKNRNPGGVVFFAASGDVTGVYYPSISANVVAVGGTTINRAKDGGTLMGESPWTSAGAGLATSVNLPLFQNALASQVQLKGKRGVVDLAAVADAKMGGVLFYDANNEITLPGLPRGWGGGGGTSAATAIMAGIANSAGHAAHTSQQELDYIYKSLQGSGINPNNFTDIDMVANPNLLSRGCGRNGTQYIAIKGWDFCTGLGTPNGLGGL